MNQPEARFENVRGVIVLVPQGVCDHGVRMGIEDCFDCQIIEYWQEHSALLEELYEH